MASVDEIIDRLGGAERAAALTGVTVEAVRKWRQARAIPSRHWPVILKETGLALADLPGRETPAAPAPDAPPPGATAALVLADGSVFWGRGFGAHGTALGEVCFTTGMTGYQETLTDPSFAGQIITFTFPHIGNVGTNAEDIEATTPFARGLVVRDDPTPPSNWRAARSLPEWCAAHGL
ncbi:MAG: carbamoyl phosphate synthase small subunit, partial [Elioraea sp.]|nr:carbamoyl phosphate synthase small subunit [Elioraea sp.]